MTHVLYSIARDIVVGAIGSLMATAIVQWLKNRKDRLGNR